jgi:hypothetical protein
LCAIVNLDRSLVKHTPLGKGGVYLYGWHTCI